MFGIDKYNYTPWTPLDSLSITYMQSHLLQNHAGASDLLKEVMEDLHEDLADIVDDILVLTAEDFNHFVSTVDEADLKQWEQFSEETLSSRYKQAKKDKTKSAEKKQVIEIRELEADSNGGDALGNESLLDDGIHSNAWAISGKHTKNGLPLLASDPHLKSTIPSTWVLNSIVYDDNYVIGASFLGIPNIAYGRTKHMAWGHTTPFHDGVDLWVEEIN